MNAPPPAATSLTELERADLVRRVLELEEAYQFKHNLIQESVYLSLLKNDRRFLHRECAHALEQAFPGELDQFAPLLAAHFAEAGDDAKTFVYARRAGDAAARIHALPEALMQYDTAALLAARLPVAAGDLLDVHQKRARVLENMGKFEDAAEAYRSLDALGKTRGEPQIEISALLSLATLYSFPNSLQNLAEGARVNQLARALARETGDEQAEARALWNMQQNAYFSGHSSQAVAYSKDALALAERLGLRELRAYILNDVSRALVTVESVAAALQTLADARVLWQELDNLGMLADNLSSTAETAHLAGEMVMAENFARQSQELSAKIENVWNLAYSGGTLLTIAAQRGETRRALEFFNQTVEYARQVSFPIAAAIANTQRVQIWGDLGQVERGLEFMYAQEPNPTLPFQEGWRAATITRLLLQRGDLPAARAELELARRAIGADDLSSYGPLYLALCSSELALQEARYEAALNELSGFRERLRTAGIRYLLPEILVRFGRAQLGLGQTEAGEETLREAEAVARYTQARFPVWEILADLSAIDRIKGRLEQAQSRREEARQLVTWLAEQAPDEFRASFLAQPKIRALLET